MAEPLWQPSEDRIRDANLTRFEGMIGRIANRLQRKLMAQQQRSWDFDLDEGILDAARLTRIIMNPSMAIAWVLGLWLAFQAGWFAAPWFHAKLLAALAMSGVHGYFVVAVRKFAEDRNDKSARYWRMMNEVPTILMILIVILVIVKPF